MRLRTIKLTKFELETTLRNSETNRKAEEDQADLGMCLYQLATKWLTTTGLT